MNLNGSLDKFGVEYGTDKSSLRHHYLSLYQLLFDGFRDDISILEIGVQFGNSLRTWHRYFPKAYILGIDSIDNGVEKDGFQIMIGDAYSGAALKQLQQQLFHILIDDGSHEPEHQRFFVTNYCHLLTGNGILIVEDIGSRDTIPLLSSALPPGYFKWTAIEMALGQTDSRLFIATRLWPPAPRSEAVHQKTESHYAPPL